MPTISKCKGLSIICLLILCGAMPFQMLGKKHCYVVCDSASNNPIPYCNVLINNDIGLVSNHKGQFCFSDTKAVDSMLIQISNISYQTKTIYVNDVDTAGVIYLNAKSYGISTVDINWKKYKFDWLGNPVKESDGYINLWRFCQLGVGIKPSKKRRQIIESVKVPIYNNADYKVPFRLHVYRITDNGEVGEELLPENVYGQLLQDADIVTLDILKYQISIPPDGVFVSIELLSNNKPEELMLSGRKYFEKDNNRIAFTDARYKHRKLLKLSAWKPNSFYVEQYPFTNVENMLGKLPMIKVKVRSLKN